MIRPMPGGVPPIIDPARYAAEGYPHELWTRLRREEPFAYTEVPGRKPFWAVTRYADIVAISRQPRLFANAPRFAVNPDAKPSDVQGEERHLLNMDPPEHGAYRRLLSARFTPRALRSSEARILEIARRVVDDVAGDGGERELDFVTDIAAVMPIAVVAEFLGVPESDWPLLFQWTNQVVGPADPEYQTGASGGETLDRARAAVFDYFGEMLAKRRRQPTADLTSLLANARVNGAPVPELELLSYCLVLVAAGNETTRNATSGGLRALIEHPEQLARLRADPARLPGAIEEILRWTSPVVHFCRTATGDAEVGDHKVRAGDCLALFYPSANRDESVFAAPFRFRIDRTPNPHLAFGIGEHFCLGAHLARLELRAILTAVLERIDRVELAGTPDRLRSVIVGGAKHMPIRCAFRPRPAA